MFSCLFHSFILQIKSGHQLADCLLGRHTCSAVPTLSLPFRSDAIQRTQHEKEVLKAKSAAHMDTKRRDLRPLRAGDAVHIQPLRPHEKIWKEAMATEKWGQDYPVTSEGRSYRRNRQFLRRVSHSHETASPALEVVTPAYDSLSPSRNMVPSSRSVVSCDMQNDPLPTTRQERIIKKLHL